MASVIASVAKQSILRLRRYGLLRLAMTRIASSLRSQRVPHCLNTEPGDPAKFFFIIFVDAIFTTLFQRLFTNAFDVIGANAANSCVYRACNAD